MPVNHGNKVSVQSNVQLRKTLNGVRLASPSDEQAGGGEIFRGCLGRTLSLPLSTRTAYEGDHAGQEWGTARAGV